jgi:hypothetical protein
MDSRNHLCDPGSQGRPRGQEEPPESTEMPWMLGEVRSQRFTLSLGTEPRRQLAALNAQESLPRRWRRAEGGDRCLPRRAGSLE